MTAQQSITRIDAIEVHSRRAKALTQMLMTYCAQGDDEPSQEVIAEVLAEICERQDAIGAEIHRIEKQ
ncbi:hypothetical protein [Halomonas sp. BC04]|uniref:hypothetical protein n=1 Tax=Halomonas sp. BC04 TaxID=1403540 RepID=UPI0003ED650E|nr:hypothetical protein [Halomonas sp. BC04]EWH00463.1 hypothetical protein Q427_19365 [Halomonas sp. BC04]